MSREAVLRRRGWKELGGGNAALVTRVLDENLDVLFEGLGLTQACSKPTRRKARKPFAAGNRNSTKEP
jgi:hypothetical protein